MTLDHIDIYINNLCNRTCEGCVTYSNFAFTGHYDFKVSEDYLNKWSEILHLEEINLLGGEPFLHSDLLSWVTGVKSIFKNS
jgi:organic radical activating enzyme